MADKSNKGHPATAQRALRKIVKRMTGGEDFGLTEEEHLELLQLTDDLERYRYKLEEVQGELEDKNKQLRKLSRELETTGLDLFDYLESIPVAFVRLSRKGIVEKFNSAAWQMLSEPDCTLLGKPFSNFVTPEDLGIYFGSIKNDATKNSPSNFELRIAGAKNREFNAHIQVEPKFEPTGKFSHWHIAIFDVSQARLQEMRLKEVHEQLEMAARSAELGVWNYDMARGTSKWNSQLYRLLGLEPREGPEDGERFFEFIHPEDRDGSIANISAVLDSSIDHIKEEFRVVRADGKTRWLAARGRIYRDESGRPTLISGINYDITERKKAEETIRLAQLQLSMQLAETKRINEELSQFAYAVSHDLKEPLRAIRNYAQFLYEDLAGTLTGNQKTYLEGLKRAVDQGDTLINDLLALSRIDRTPAEAENVDVPALIAEVRSLANLPAEVEFTVASNCPPLKSDHTLLKQILHNLISNAAKFNHSNPATRNWCKCMRNSMNDEASSTPIRVLLVEDSEHDQIAFLRALSKSELSFEVTVCERAEGIPAALQAGSESVDIVVLDQNLPGISGLAAYKELQQKSGMPPFVMLTGTGSENLAVDALKAGIYDYIIKDPMQGYLLLLPLKLKDVKQRYADAMTRLKAEADLKKAHSELEKMVELRTAELSRTVEALVAEIAERKQTEKALRDSEQTLRHLSLKIIETQENERRQIAKELHDSIGSSLAAIKFAVEGKLETMKNGPPNDTITLAKIAGHIHDTIDEVRRISTSLRPSMLDDLGLLATIKWYCRSSREMHAETRIETNLVLDDDEVPEYSKIVIYRVLQESLSNALRHSRAGTVWVSLEAVNDCVRLCVKDDGCGFDPEDAMQSSDPLSGYGLRGMRDRAEVVGGSLSLNSSPGRGTTVCLELPLVQNWASTRSAD